MLVKVARFALALALATGIETEASAAPPARDKAGGSKAACVAAHEQAQTLRTQKKLHAAHDKFVACARAECPVVLRKECGEQLESLEATAPTVVVEALDDKGASDSNVKVSLDGMVVAERLTGAAIDVEPGDHVFKFERASDGKSLESHVLVVEGEKNRKVVADFQTLLPPKAVTTDEAPPPSSAKTEPKHIPLFAYVAAAVGVVGFGSFAFFALTGKSAENGLAKSCAPTCASDRVTSVKRDYAIGDVSLAVGVVGVVTAVVLAIPALTSSRASVSASVAGPPPWLPRPRLR